jgi:hypothetical protein
VDLVEPALLGRLLELTDKLRARTAGTSRGHGVR